MDTRVATAPLSSRRYGAVNWLGLKTLIQREVQRIYVINRTPARAEELRKAFGARVHPARWDEITGLLGATLPNRDGVRMIGDNGKASLFDGRRNELRADVAFAE